MAFKLSQKGRFGKLSTAFGDDRLVLMRFDGSDYVDDLFEYSVAALSMEADLDIGSLIGTLAQVEFVARKGGPRYMNGIVTRAEWAGVGENGHRYHLQLRPWFWLCGRRRNQRIFHNKTVVEIIQEVLIDWSEAPSPSYELRLQNDYPVLEYTVQYGESDLAFLSRQMERFGISYHFRHQDGAHILTLTDDIGGFDPVAGSSREYRPDEGEHNYDREHFFDWRAGRALTTGAVRLTDYNFKKPKASMELNRIGESEHPFGQIESYDYPGDYPDQGGGRPTNALRLRQETAGDHRHVARGNTVSLGAGMTVTLTGDQKASILGRSYLCLAARHSYQSDNYGTGNNQGDNWSFSGEYTLTPADAPYAPARKTPVPRIYGPQTAVVVGEGEIDCDEFGRILVRFHWDLAAANSMRCRVMQHSASGEWGGMVIPRIGMEAMVEFLEGDPDKPIVTGCVFNGQHDSPYKLPAHKTKHVIRADTHRGSGFNEISFEAEAGRENMAIHAQKDQTFRVLNDQSSNISANRIENIGANASQVIAANKMERVGANKSMTVGGSGAGLLQMLMPLVQAGGKFLGKGARKAGSPGGVVGYSSGVASVADLPRELAAITMNGSFGGSGEHRSAGGAAQLGSGSTMARLLSMIMPASGIFSTTVERFMKVTVGEAATEQVGFAKNTVVGQVMTTSVGKLMQTKVGEDIDIESKKSIFARTKKHTLHAKEKFIIGGPGGTIIIDQSGITIKARTLKIKSPSVDFSSGNPDQVDALASDKAFAQECKK